MKGQKGEPGAEGIKVRSASLLSLGHKAEWWVLCTSVETLLEVWDETTKVTRNSSQLCTCVLKFEKEVSK